MEPISYVTNSMIILYHGQGDSTSAICSQSFFEVQLEYSREDERQSYWIKKTSVYRNNLYCQIKVEATKLSFMQATYFIAW